MSLTGNEIYLLTSKMPSDLTRKLRLLYQLDRAFMFNRRELSNYLRDCGLNGYSERSLGRIMGTPVICPHCYKFLLDQVKTGLLDPILLELWCQSAVFSRIVRTSEEWNDRPYKNETFEPET